MTNLSNLTVFCVLCRVKHVVAYRCPMLRGRSVDRGVSPVGPGMATTSDVTTIVFGAVR